jgi:hypothetical protein
MTSATNQSSRKKWLSVCIAMDVSGGSVESRIRWDSNGIMIFIRVPRFSFDFDDGSVVLQNNNEEPRRHQRRPYKLHNILTDSLHKVS